MYCLYDKEGILRYVNSDRDACLDYAELFDLNSANFCLMNLVESEDKVNDINLHQYLVENNN